MPLPPAKPAAILPSQMALRFGFSVLCGTISIPLSGRAGRESIRERIKLVHASANAERGSIVTTNAMRAIIANARLSRVFMCIPHYRLFAAMQSMAHYHANR